MIPLHWKETLKLGEDGVFYIERRKVILAKARGRSNRGDELQTRNLFFAYAGHDADMQSVRELREMAMMAPVKKRRVTLGEEW